MSSRRVAAAAALVLAAAAVAAAVALTFADSAHALAVLACLAVAVGTAWYGALRRGAARIAGFAVAAVAFAGVVVIVALGGHLLATVVVVVVALGAVAAASAAFVVRVALPEAPPPARPVLFYNPKSGGGKAERFHVADEARARGIEPIELGREDDLATLVNDVVARGADGLAMAGGDGSQAIVAAIAADRGLPYACIPAGTRNHLALDLGVDRDDVVGALDAFVDGGERVVDLAEVNGRVFVNNVSLGLYAQAVQRSEYRDAKLRTILDTVPDVLGPDAAGDDLRWRGPDDRMHRSRAAILVSNNRYRLGRAIGSGMRPRLDEGVVGVTVFDEGSRGVGPGPLRQWGSPEFEVEADAPVAAGIDGEAATLDPPLRFRIRRRALRVRIAAQHPGASPSAGAPDGLWDAIRKLAQIAARGG